MILSCPLCVTAMHSTHKASEHKLRITTQLGFFMTIFKLPEIGIWKLRILSHHHVVVVLLDPYCIIHVCMGACTIVVCISQLQKALQLILNSIIMR